MNNEIELYRAGKLRGQAVLELFSYLMKSGKVWDLGFGKYSISLISRGYLSDSGAILRGL